MEIGLHDIVVGIVGLGMVLKGFVDSKSNGKACNCQFTRADYNAIMLEFKWLKRVLKANGDN